FMGYSLSTASMGAAFQSFLAGAPFALIVVMGVSPEDLWIFIMSVPAGYVVGNFISSRASQRVHRDRMILAGSVLASLCTAALVALPAAGPSRHSLSPG
ncbi:MAG: Bcr/CflA family drug resistance efflux transporter, partial [Alphaproteobacteria bacterium]|nr:Bcr/CflA family drug resistance efflux transporter [Alphaproteobacteria bacterium]